MSDREATGEAEIASLRAQLAQQAADLAKAERENAAAQSAVRALEALAKLQIRFGFMYRGTHYKENTLDPTSIVLLAGHLGLLHSASTVKPLTSGMAEPDGNSLDFLANRPVKP